MNVGSGREVLLVKMRKLPNFKLCLRRERLTLELYSWDLALSQLVGTTRGLFYRCHFTRVGATPRVASAGRR